MFSREVMARGCQRAGLVVRRFVERELGPLTGDRLGVAANAITQRLKQMGLQLGPPWGEDYKIAMQAGWILLDN